MSQTILVIEDDSAVRRGLVDLLSLTGYEVLSAADGTEGRRLALTANYSLLLLDLVLPGFTGFEILDALRRDRPGQAVIVLSARGEEADRVRGLITGADDYIVKPFSPRELLARVDAVLRRSSERLASTETVSIAGREIDFSTQKITFEKVTVTLSEREISLLRYLLANPGRIVTRSEILQRVWGLGSRHRETRTIDMHVAHLRKKLGDSSQSLLQTVRGKGYLWSP